MPFEPIEAVLVVACQILRNTSTALCPHSTKSLRQLRRKDWGQCPWIEVYHLESVGECPLWWGEWGDSTMAVWFLLFVHYCGCDVWPDSWANGQSVNHACGLCGALPALCESERRNTQCEAHSCNLQRAVSPLPAFAASGLAWSFALQRASSTSTR